MDVLVLGQSNIPSAYFQNWYFCFELVSPLSSVCTSKEKSFQPFKIGYFAS